MNPKCDKRCHSTRKIAKAKQKRLAAKFGNKMDVYYCAFHDAWHLGNDRNNIKKHINYRRRKEYVEYVESGFAILIGGE